MPGPGLNAYKKTMKETSSGRDLEAHVLTKAAQSLRDCQKHWEEEGHRERLDNALRMNQKIWTIFQSDLASDSNPLPQQLKNDILSLSLFIDKRVFEVMASPSPEKLDAIININLNIAEGLRGTRGKTEEVQTAKPEEPDEATSPSRPISPSVYSRGYAK